MRITLIGYGKMGKLIEELAMEAGHKIVARITSSNRDELNESLASKTDVAIEFTSPHSAYDNVMRCLQLGIPLICGSTGWNDKLPEVKEYCKKVNGSFLHASNFSIGVNIFFQINSILARLMNEQKDYDVHVHEVHHTQKKDAPSGTAVTIAELILEELNRKKFWVAGEASSNDQLSITSERVDPAPGTHHVVYESEIDTIEIIHTAHNRNGFALGALRAAEFIKDKKGVFEMKDVLGNR